MVEIPDQYGLSSDSLRGSVQHVRTDLVGAPSDGNDVRRSDATGQVLTRQSLSANERLVLRQAGVLVDADAKSLVENAPVSPATALFRPRTSPRVTRDEFETALSTDEERLTAEQWAAKVAAEKAPEERLTRVEWEQRYRDSVATTSVDPGSPIPADHAPDVVTPFGGAPEPLDASEHHHGS